MREKIVAGNWKMNNDLAETQTLISDLKKNLTASEVKVMVAPTFTNLYPAYEALKDSAVEVVAQNMHQAKSGAYTGEVSAAMLKSIGITRVILGHSERRAYFGENDALLAEKVTAAVDAGLDIIFCFGEELEDRKSAKHFDLVASQLKNGLFHLPKQAWKHVVLAYEPVWAIGTGETASPEQAQEMHEFIRKTVGDHYDASLADGVAILYGGSVKPSNASEIFSKPDVDGGLIGGASLKAEDFVAIVNAF